MDIRENLAQIGEELRKELDGADAVQSLEQLRVKVLGKKGSLTALLRGMGSLSPEERPKMGQMINEAREKLTALLDAGGWLHLVLLSRQPPPHQVSVDVDAFKEGVMHQRKRQPARPEEQRHGGCYDQGHEDRHAQKEHDRKRDEGYLYGRHARHPPRSAPVHSACRTSSA